MYKLSNIENEQVFMKHLSGYPYGETLRDASISAFTLTETAYASSLKLPKHSHEKAYFCFVLGGGFTEIYAEGSRSCRPSTLIFHPAAEPHSDQFHADTRCFNIQMHPRWLERVRQHSRIIDAPADFFNGRLAHLAARLYSEFRESDEFSPLVVEGFVLEMLAQVSRHAMKSERTPPGWLEQAREVLHTCFGECWSLVALAELVGVHPAHLARQFRRFYRCTVGDYVRRRRIEFACQHISASDAPFSEIAATAGFFDQSHFARTFKTHTGMTPSQYRTAFGSRKPDTNALNPYNLR